MAPGILALAEQQLMNSFSRSCHCGEVVQESWALELAARSEKTFSCLRDASPGLNSCLWCGSPSQVETSPHAPLSSAVLTERADFMQHVSKLQWEGNESLCSHPHALLFTACFVFLLFTFLALLLSMAFTGELLDALGQPGDDGASSLNRKCLMGRPWKSSG